MSFQERGSKQGREWDVQTRCDEGCKMLSRGPEVDLKFKVKCTYLVPDITFGQAASLTSTSGLHTWMLGDKQQPNPGRFFFSTWWDRKPGWIMDAGLASLQQRHSWMSLNKQSWLWHTSLNCVLLNVPSNILAFFCFLLSLIAFYRA